MVRPCCEDRHDAVGPPLSPAMSGAATVFPLVLGLEVLMAVVANVMSRPKAEERAVRLKMREAKLQMRQYTTPALFVAKAKLERQVIAMEKAVTQLQTARAATSAKQSIACSKTEWM